MGVLELAIAAFVISPIGGALGWSGVAKGSAKVAKIAFAIFMVIAIILVLLLVLGIGAVT